MNKKLISFALQKILQLSETKKLEAQKELDIFHRSNKEILNSPLPSDENDETVELRAQLNKERAIANNQQFVASLNGYIDGLAFLESEIEQFIRAVEEAA